MPIRLLIIHCFNFITIFWKYKWFYQFIITQVIFRHFLSVGIGNELLLVCHNFNYPIQSTKLILLTFSRNEMQSVIEVVCLIYRSLAICFVSKYCERREISHIKGIYCKGIDFLLFNTFWCYRSSRICSVSKYYKRWEINFLKGIG